MLLPARICLLLPALAVLQQQPCSRDCSDAAPHALVPIPRIPMETPSAPLCKGRRHSARSSQMLPSLIQALGPDHLSILVHSVAIRLLTLQPWGFMTASWTLKSLAERLIMEAECLVIGNLIWSISVGNVLDCFYIFCIAYVCKIAVIEVVIIRSIGFLVMYCLWLSRSHLFSTHVRVRQMGYRFTKCWPMWRYGYGRTGPNQSISMFHFQILSRPRLPYVWKQTHAPQSFLFSKRFSPPPLSLLKFTYVD
jgi:hypothetical protein